MKFFYNDKANIEFSLDSIQNEQIDSELIYTPKPFAFSEVNMEKRDDKYLATLSNGGFWKAKYTFNFLNDTLLVTRKLGIISILVLLLLIFFGGLDLLLLLGGLIDSTIFTLSDIPALILLYGGFIISLFLFVKWIKNPNYTMAKFVQLMIIDNERATITTDTVVSELEDSLEDSDSLNSNKTSNEVILYGRFAGNELPSVDISNVNAEKSYKYYGVQAVLGMSLIVVAYFIALEMHVDQLHKALMLMFAGLGGSTLFLSGIFCLQYARRKRILKGNHRYDASLVGLTNINNNLYDTYVFRDDDGALKKTHSILNVSSAFGKLTERDYSKDRVILIDKEVTHTCVEVVEDEDIKNPFAFKIAITLLISFLFIGTFGTIVHRYAYKDNPDFDRLRIESNRNGSKLSEKELNSVDYRYAAYITSQYYPANSYILFSGESIIGGFDISTEEQKHEALDFLDEAWGITDHKSCLNSINTVLRYGHRTRYQNFIKLHPEIKDMAKKLKAKHKNLNLEECTEITKDEIISLGAPKEEANKYKGAIIAYAIKGNKGMNAYDYQRLIRMAKVSYEVGFLSGDELKDLYHKLNHEVQKDYDNFEQIHMAYYAGEYFRTNPSSSSRYEIDEPAKEVYSYFSRHNRYEVMDLLFNVKLH
ncbi:MAG: DUF1266 domain-containing protein [Lachnospiraceae bacterium]|nr:DUF1266 domain-containing protein [Lachnospiraceae bacterium]